MTPDAHAQYLVDLLVLTPYEKNGRIKLFRNRQEMCDILLLMISEIQKELTANKLYDRVMHYESMKLSIMLIRSRVYPYKCK
jgi:hypothetical protein